MDAARDLPLLERLGARLVTPNDPDWPSGFADLRDPPPFLAVRGTLRERGVAIVGARDADDAARAFAYELARRLGTIVVAGLALGVDAAAHRGALAAGVPTIAYVGTGIARTHPPQHEELADAIVAHGGALASENAPHDDATPWSLMRRDRLQAAHAALDDAASGNAAALADGAIRLPRDADEAASRILAVL